MKFKKLAIASAIALASTGSFAAYGDIVFTDSFKGTFDSAGAGSFTWDAGTLGAGLYNFEASVTSTGNISISNGMFNSDGLGNLTPKIVYGTGAFGGGDMKVSFDFLSGAKPGGSFGGALTITSAVPEPETYALMLAGLGVMGFIAMRRKAG